MTFLTLALIALIIPSAQAAITCPLSPDQQISTESQLSDNSKLTGMMSALKTAIPGGAKAEHFIACLPAEYRKRYVLVTQSGSLQGATPQAPRVLIYGNSGKTIISYSPVASAGSIEIMQYKEVPGQKPKFQWEPKLFKTGSNNDWDFSSGTKAQGGHGGTQTCTACHGDPIVPKFDSYDRWPNTYSSISVKGEDGILPHECNDYRSFLGSVEKDPNSPYSVLPLEKSKKVKRMPNGTCMVKDGAGPSPAGQLNHLLNEMNLHRVADEIMSDKQYGKFRFLFQSAARGCGAFRSDLPMPDQSKMGLFGNGIPRDMYQKLKCDDLKKEMAITVENNFLNQVKELKGTACGLPDNAEELKGTRTEIPDKGLSAWAVFRERESENGVFYFILPKESCDPTKDPEACKKKCLSMAKTEPTRDGLRPMKLVETLGSARFEQAVQYCCAARAMGLDCREWSTASRGRSTGSYEFEDGLSGILKLGNILMQKEKEAMAREGVTTQEMVGKCYPNIQEYVAKTHEQPYDYSSPKCEGVSSFYYGPSKSIVPPFLASFCRNNPNGLSEYQKRAKECFMLAQKSHETLAPKTAGAVDCPSPGGPHIDPNFTKPYEHMKSQTELEEAATRYAENMKCPDPSYKTVGGISSDISRMRPEATIGESRGNIASEPKHPLMSGDL